MGFVISTDKLRMDLDKVEVIKNWPSPKSIFKVRSFHRLVSFYRNFIRNFVIVYIDDILIFSKTEEENLRHLNLVMRRLQQEKLLINLKKLSFYEDRTYLFRFCDLFERVEDGS